MAAQLIHGGRVVTPDGVLERGWVLIEHGTISSVGTGQAPAASQVTDATGRLVVPGFVDIHCHGGGGAAFTSSDPEHVRQAARTHLVHGTTTMLASLVSRPIPELVDQVAALAEQVSDGVVAGIHLEGPFLSAARCGAHDPAVLCPPDPESVDKLIAAGRGSVRMITIAPELDGAVPAIRKLVDVGVLAAVGHTDAIAEHVVPAVDAGASVATHLFNGMRPLHHREPGPIGVLLDDERVTVELICDLTHLHPTIVHLAATRAGTARTVLVTDAIAAAGAGDGSYEVGGLAVTVTDGVPTLAGGGSLAGSSLTMDLAFRNLVRECGISVPDAVAATSTRPAELLGLAERTGRIAASLAADLVLLDDALTPSAVMRGGTWVS